MKRASFPATAFLLLLLALAALLPGAALAQDGATDDNPVSVRLEIYVVSEVPVSGGGTEERYTEATTARPGQVVEYRLFATNEGDTTLPAGTVVLLGPVPDGTSFVPNSATPSSERVLTEFSASRPPADDTFGEPPILVGEGDERSAAEPEAYTAVRWTLLEPMPPGQEEAFFYRVTVE